MNQGRRRTGQARKTRQPFSIDSLPSKVRDEIRDLRAGGKTWQEISDLSVEFAGQRIARSTLHRWYDVRVDQAAKESEKRSVLSEPEEFAELVAGKVIARLLPLLQGRAA